MLKKFLSLLLIFLIHFYMTSCKENPDEVRIINENTPIEERGASISLEDYKDNFEASGDLSDIEEESNEIIVYRTRTGNKYHQSHCGYLKQSKIEISLKDASSKGFRPCSICRTPQ